MKILINATTRMNPENIVKSQISRTPKAKYCMIPLV